MNADVGDGLFSADDAGFHGGTCPTRGRNVGVGSDAQSIVEAAVRTELDIPTTEADVIAERIERVILGSTAVVA